MEIGVLVGSITALLIIGVPIGIAFGAGLVLLVLLFDTTTLEFIAQQMWTGLDSIPLLAIPMFIIAGALMETGGLSRRLVNFASKLVGNVYGGLGTVSVLACMLFGAISGSGPATVAAIGTIMIPYMVRTGYNRNYSTALVACAGGLGVIVPPSIPLILYGACTHTSVGDLFLGGLAPAVLIAAALITVSYVISRKRGYRGEPSGFNLKELGQSAWEAKWALLMPIIILGGIYSGAFTPTEAAVIAILYSTVIGLFVTKELKWRDLITMLDKNSSFLGGFMLACVPAAAMGAILAMLNVPVLLTNALLAISSNMYVIMLIVNIFLVFAGMVIDTIPAILIFAPLLYSALIPMGIDPVQLGIIITVNLAIGFITPPVANNLFIASTMTGIPMGKIVKEALPFVISMFVVLVLISFIPEISLLPLLLTQ